MGRMMYRPINYKKPAVNLEFTTRTLILSITLVLILFAVVFGKDYLMADSAPTVGVPQAETAEKEPKGFDVTFPSPGGGTLTFKVEYDRNGGVKQ